MRRALALALSAVVAGCTTGATGPPTAGEPTVTPAARPTAPVPPPTFWLQPPLDGEATPFLAKVPATGIALEPGRVRLLPPRLADGPRRVALQIGHWRASEAPREFPTLRRSPGGSFGDLTEVEVATKIAERARDLLRERGIVVDVLPATVPPSYIADAFVSLHADVDLTSTAQGFKVARGTYRSPYDAALVAALSEHYAAATELPWDPNVTAAMTDYYAFAWFRYEHALAPHTPAAIVELGFISHPRDRDVLVEHGERAARGVVEGILRFLDAHPRATLFGEEIGVRTVPAPSASPSPSAP